MRLAAVERVLYDVVEQAGGLKSKTSVVIVSEATAPTDGQVLTATGPTAAVWEALPTPATIPSGGDPSTPALRALGTGQYEAAAGNDSRFTASHAPAAHASTHLGAGSSAAGSDPIPIVSIANDGLVPSLPTVLGFPTEADTTMFLRGDGSWAVPPGG